MNPVLRLVSQNEKTPRIVKSRQRVKDYLTDQEVRGLTESGPRWKAWRA